jgi:hypothetical protein
MKVSRLSRAYFPNVGRPDDSPELYAFMFIRDIHTGIMPFRRGREYPFTVKLARKNQNLEKQLNEFLGIGQGTAWSLDESLWQTTETLSHYLAALGETYLEIVYDDEKAGNGLTGRSLVFLPRGKMLKLFSYYIQIVPIRNWKRREKKFYVIPSNRIWHIKLPRKLATPRKHRKMLKKLNTLSEPMPEFALKDGELGGSVKYDFTKHHYNKEIAVEHTTTRWGSIRSLSQIKGTTEYYYIVNRLQATYSQALLREHIFAEVNKLLHRLGVKNSVKVEGLSSSSELLQAIKKLEKGEIGFSEALKAIED